MMNKLNNFGDLLRGYRKAKGHTLGAFAGILGMSATNLSDVELGRRQPLRVDQIERAAKILTLTEPQVDGLVTAAAATRGAIELRLDDCRRDAAAFGAILMREWSTMSHDDVEQLNALVRKLGSNKPKKVGNP
jgi:transcriptional regulator with XRE-family HTH domain